MPIYGYRCKQCAHEFEIFQRMADDPLKACPECMGPLQKQLYPTGIVFKGSGFYKTDYASASEKSKSSEGASTPSSEGSDSAKTEAPKPDSVKSEAPKADKVEKPKKESASSSSGSKE